MSTSPPASINQSAIIPETPDASIVQPPTAGQPKPPSPDTVAAFRRFAAKFAPVTTDANRVKLQHMLHQFDPLTNLPVPDRSAELADARSRLADAERSHSEHMRLAAERVDRLQAEIKQLSRQRNASAGAVTSRRQPDGAGEASASESSFIESIHRSGMPVVERRLPDPLYNFVDDDSDVRLLSSGASTASSLNMPLPPPRLSSNLATTSVHIDHQQRQQVRILSHTKTRIPYSPNYPQQQYSISRRRISSTSTLDERISLNVIRRQCSGRRIVAAAGDGGKTIDGTNALVCGSALRTRKTIRQKQQQIAVKLPAMLTDTVAVAGSSAATRASAAEVAEAAESSVGEKEASFRMPPVHPLYMRRRIVRDMNAPWQ